MDCVFTVESLWSSITHIHSLPIGWTSHIAPPTYIHLLIAGPVTTLQVSRGRVTTWDTQWRSSTSYYNKFGFDPEISDFIRFGWFGRLLFLVGWLVYWLVGVDLFILFSDKVSFYIPCWPETGCTAQASLNLPQPPKSSDCRCEPLGPDFGFWDAVKRVNFKKGKKHRKTDEQSAAWFL